MKLLLDTQALLWFVWDDPKLTEQAAALVQDAQNDKYVSIAGLWEIAIKVNIGKLRIAESPAEFIQKHVIGNGFQVLWLSTEHITRYADMPLHHRDPFDRILVAQCFVEGLVLVSADGGFDAYGVKRLWETPSGAGI